MLNLEAKGRCRAGFSGRFALDLLTAALSHVVLSCHRAIVLLSHFCFVVSSAALETMPPIESPQLRFLSDAAQLLGSCSPSTAAHLLDAHTRILHDDHKLLNVRQQRHHCGSCGSLRQSQSTKIVDVRPRKKSALGSGAKVYKCTRCQQRTVIPRRKTIAKTQLRTYTAATSSIPTSSTSTDVTSSTKASPQHPTAEPQPSKAEENAGSKKRAKVRKQGGLQALLAAKKNAQPSLDLLDFLQ